MKEKDLDKIKAMSAYGMGVREMAGIVGVSVDELEHEIKYGEAGSRIELGRSQALFQVKKAAYEMAASGEHPAMTKAWLEDHSKL